ncbi:sirohydrochlorin chelatase [Actinospica sp.]|jgi:sirohydrochlorin ferrochelatase|uniref:sirohydrochlorin chelatase n=1 Tax=Actinospica sp. TaxID=1872142 RepID=UPI002BC733D6|nr:sirohydrochlorin chelatase [Actinospica sp.]HWG25968.1 sirohydrochlorin chelatase [Actinospica sp.]
MSRLLLVAHGSRDPRYAASYETLCLKLRQQGHAALVGHLGLCGPDVVESARLLAREGGGEPIVAVPMFLNHGYHVAHDVPEVVARAGAAVSHARIVVADPLGPDPLLVEAMESRLRELGVWPGDPDTAVVLASAGTSDAAARGVLESAAAEWARTGWHSVSPAYAGAAAPGAAEAVGAARAAGARDVVIASYFLAPGLLADRVATGAPGIRMAAPFATPADVDPALTRLLLRRATAALAKDPHTRAGRPRPGIRSGSALRR